MTTDEATELLLSKGYVNGWAVCLDQLLLWEYEEDPPKPLKKPIV